MHTNVELMNYTQWVIAVLWVSFKSTLFSVLVQVLLGRSDLWRWSEVGFQIKVIKMSLQRNWLLELSGAWRRWCYPGHSIDAAVLGVIHRFRSHCLSSPRQWDTFRSGLCGVSAAMASCAGLELSASHVLILGCLPSGFNWGFETTTEIKPAYNFWSFRLCPCFGGHITNPKSFQAASSVFWQKHSLYSGADACGDLGKAFWSARGWLWLDPSSRGRGDLRQGLDQVVL